MSQFRDNKVERDTDHHIAGLEAWERGEEMFEALSTEEKLEGFLEDHLNCLDLVDALLKAKVDKPTSGKEVALDLCEGMRAWVEYKREWVREWMEQ